jgi:hypothetical protein
MSLQQDLMAIERALWTGGPDAYEEHTDDECLVAFTEMAGVMSRRDIAKTAEQGRWKDVVLTSKGLAELTDGAAMITYECAARRKDGQPYRALVSSAYVKRPDGWKIAFHQQTPLQ